MFWLDRRDRAQLELFLAGMPENGAGRRVEGLESHFCFLIIENDITTRLKGFASPQAISERHSAAPRA